MTQQSLFFVFIQKNGKHLVAKNMHSYFIIALYMVANTWKQPKCPLMDDWVKKM